MVHMVSVVSLNKPILNNLVQYDGIVSNSYFIHAISHSVQVGEQIKMVVLDISVAG